MRFFKSILVSIALLIVCSVGVIAQEPATAANVTMPTQYFDGTEVKSVPEKLKNIANENKSMTLGAEESQILTDGDWYWAGGETEGTTANVSNITLPNSGEVNIVVGPNGIVSNPAMTITNSDTWTIPNGLTVNIYAAAADNVAFSNQNCHLKVVNSAGPGITVSGGTLNIYAGDLEGASSQNSTSAGVSVTSGTVNINGELQGNTTTTTSTDEANFNGAVSITGGTVNLNQTGFLMSTEGEKGTTPSAVSVTGGTLNLNGGTVYTSTSEPSSTTGANCLWVKADGTNKNATVYGNAYFSFGCYTVAGFEAQGDSITVPAQTTLTIPSLNPAWFSEEDVDLYNAISFANGAQMSISGTVYVNSPGGLNFDYQSDATGSVTSTGRSTLQINQGGVLNIGTTGNVNMGRIGSPSILNNQNGQINVDYNATTSITPES